MKTITDGSAVFMVRDKRIQGMIDMFYPVGSVYISADKDKTKADFPFMQYGTWEEVPANLCLQTGDASEAGTRRSPGLPNIKGTVNTQTRSDDTDYGASGALSSGEANGKYIISSSLNTSKRQQIKFDASKSNAIYGSSDTVQPPAYMVRAWVRTS